MAGTVAAVPRPADGRRAELGAAVAAAAAWVAVIALHGGPATPHGGHGGPAAADPAAALALWALMCVAMMVPVTWPAVRHVATNSLRWRRGRAVATFLTAYLAVWIAFGAVAPAALRALGDGGGLPDRAVLAGTLGAAAAWQVLPYQRRFVRDCHRSVALPPRGRAAAVACLRFGTRHGRACLGACWPVMLVMAAVTAEPVGWMAALTAVVAVVKLQPGSRWTGGPLAAMLGGLGLVVLVT